MVYKTICYCLSAGILVGLPGWSESDVEVPPGSVVRWPGTQVERCQLAERTWQPMSGECWYGIDLLQPAGELELRRQRNGKLETVTVRVAEYPYPVQHITLQDDSKVDLSPEDLRRVENESRRIASLWDRMSPRRFTLPLAAPLETLPAAGRFGSRRFFNNQPRSPHSGADYAAAAGEAVLAVADGTVALAGDFFFSGNSVFIDHGDGMISMYFHLREIAVQAEQEISRGDLVGRVGATGRATGPHLHLGVRWHGARIDPAQVLANPSEVLSLR